MRYYAQFRSIQTNTLYEVEIITKGDTSKQQEIILSSNPFTTQMTSSSDDMYSPIKSQKGNLHIIADGMDDLKLDIFTSTAKGTRVNLYKVADNGKKTIEFIGYADPVVYQNDYKSDSDEMEINVLDGISILDKMNYDCGGFDKDMNCLKRNVNLQYVLDKIVKAGGYGKWYFPTCLKLTKDSTSDLLKYLVISEKNFFDDRNDTDKPTDYDCATKMSDVLEDICRWLNVIVMSYKDSVFFIDLDAVNNGFNEYWLYTSPMKTPTKVTLSDNKTITKSMYMSDDTSIQLDKTFRKIEIRDKFNTYDDTFPDFFDSTYLTNITPSGTTLTNLDNVWSFGMDVAPKIVADFYKDLQDNDSLAKYTKAGYDGNMEVIFDLSETARHKDKYYFVAEKYYTSDLMTCYMYEWNDITYNSTHKIKLLGKSGESGYPSSFCIRDVKYLDKNYYGAILKKEYSKDISDDDVKKVVKDTDNWTNSEKIVNEVSKQISNLSFTNSIQMMVKGGSTRRFSANDKAEYDKYYKNFPMFTTNFKNYKEPNLFGGKNSFLVLTGKVNLSHDDPAGYSKEYQYNKGIHQSIIFRDNEYIWCRLRVGKYYFKGYDVNSTLSNIDDIRKNCWSTTPSDFKLYFGNDEGKDIKLEEINTKDQSFRNTVRWWFGLSDEGFVVPTPSNDLLMDNVEFTMYTPMQYYGVPAWNDDSDKVVGRAYYIWIKDLKCKTVIGNPTFADESSQTIFTNIIDENYVDDKQGVEMTVTTNDNKKPNYSSVAYSGNSRYFIDKIYNAALSTSEKDKTDVDNVVMAGLGRQEEHLLYRYYNQYNSPSVRLTMTLSDEEWKPYTLVTEPLLKKQFYIDTIAHNYVNDCDTIEIREIKK